MEKGRSNKTIYRSCITVQDNKVALFQLISANSVKVKKLIIQK